MDDIVRSESRDRPSVARRGQGFAGRTLIGLSIVALCVATCLTTSSVIASEKTGVPYWSADFATWGRSPADLFDTLRDYYRTLHSLRRIPGTKAYLMDYYVDYHIDEVRAHGVDVKHVDDSVLGVLLPKWTLPVAVRLKSRFLSEQIEAIEAGEHCSTVTLHSKKGHVFFGRNLDYKHDACLILKVHGHDAASSVAVLDLHYLNLDRDDLEQTSLTRRLPLLFAPYYLQDGMNQYGVAVADMSVPGVRAVRPGQTKRHPFARDAVDSGLCQKHRRSDRAAEAVQHLLRRGDLPFDDRRRLGQVGSRRIH